MIFQTMDYGSHFVLKMRANFAQTYCYSHKHAKRDFFSSFYAFISFNVMYLAVDQCQI